MNCCKEIGGYFGLECGPFQAYHKAGILLNSARNALRYIIRAYHIEKMLVPYYTCPVVWQSIQEENCQIMPYDIDDDLMPKGITTSDSFVLYNNYFGVCSININKLKSIYPRLIVDGAQSFFMPKCGIASFYSPRKFFGLPDGGIAVCDSKYQEDFDVSVSYGLCYHLLKRLDVGAQKGYADFQKNDSALIGRPIQYMSNLTRSLMGNIDYEGARNRRLKNFYFLHRALKKQNMLNINLLNTDVPMVYPFKTDDFSLRKKLIKHKIFVARYWPIEGDCKSMTSKLSQSMADMIVPLPIDQRYNLEDMSKILGIING